MRELMIDMGHNQVSSRVVILLVLLLISLVSSALGADTESNCSHKSIDVVFVVDGSSSIRAEDFDQYTKTFLESFVSHLSFDDKTQPTRVSVVLFSSTARTRLVLPLAGDKTMVSRALSGLKRIGGGQTDTARGLELAYKQFQNAVDLDHKRVVILLTDGHNTQGENPSEVSKRLQTDFNAQVLAVGVSRAVNSAFLDSIASEPVSSNSFHVMLLSQVSSLINPLVDRICSSKAVVASLSIPAVQENTNTMVNIQSNTAELESVNSGSAASLSVPALQEEEESTNTITNVQSHMEESNVQSKAMESSDNTLANVQSNQNINVLKHNKEHSNTRFKLRSVKLGDVEKCAHCARDPVIQTCTKSGKKYANRCFAECRQEVIVECKECQECPLHYNHDARFRQIFVAQCDKPSCNDDNKCDCPMNFEIENLCGKSGRKYASECHAICRGDEIVPCPGNGLGRKCAILALRPALC
jgi:uncharacterized protein YegL